MHLSLTRPLSEIQGAALGLNPFKSFLASDVRHPCPSHAPAWDAAVMLLHGSFLRCLRWVWALACLRSSSLISPALPRTLFCYGCPQARCELLRLGTTLSLVPIAVVLLVLIIKLRLYKKGGGQLGPKLPCTVSFPCFLTIFRNICLFIVQHDISFSGASQPTIQGHLGGFIAEAGHM